MEIYPDVNAPSNDADKLYQMSDQLMQHEIQILYTASNRLNQAATPAEQLEAISDYPRQQGATQGILFYVDNPEQDPIEWVTVVAEWVLNEQQRAGVGKQLKTLQMNFVQDIMSHPAQPTLFEDVQNLTDIDPKFMEISTAFNLRASVALPISNGRRWIGIIWFTWDRPHRFNEQDYRIYHILLQQIAPVIDSARLFERLRERTSRAEIMNRINTALSLAVNEKGIVAALGQYATPDNIYGMSLIYIDTDEITGERMLRPVTVWHEGEVLDFDPDRHHAGLYLSSGIVDLWVDCPDDVVYVENLAEDPRISPETRAGLLPIIPIRAFLLIPLVSGGRYHGVLGVSWTEPHTFSPVERYVCDNLLQVLPAVVGSRRAYLAERQRARELEAIARVSAAAAGKLDEYELLNIVNTLTRDRLDDYAIVIYLLDEDGKRLMPVIDAEQPLIALDSVSLNDTSSLVAEAARSRHSIIVNDIHRPLTYRLTPSRPNVRSEMALPLVATDRLIGVLEIQSEMVNRFSQADTRVMGTLADLIAVAIQNARLYRGAQSYAVLEERNRLARELHDSVSQALYGIALGARTARTRLDLDPHEAKEPLDYVLALAEAGIAEMRALIFELRPETLEREGLIEALMKQVDMIKARYGLTVQTGFCCEPPLSLEHKEAIYWITREALHNIVKHARATQIELSLELKQDTFIVYIIDNGIGFDTSGEFTGHLGLKSMSERAVRVGGQINIMSVPGGGTQIELQLPF